MSGAAPAYTLVTPFPPQRNGIADYAWQIARASDPCPPVVTEALRPHPAQPEQTIIDPQRYLAAPGAWPPPLYHIGNNPDHAFMVGLFLRRPGVVVVHDLSLHYLAQQVDAVLPGFYAMQLRAEGQPVASLMARLGPAGLVREMDHRELRLLSWLRAAPALVVHSAFARRLLEQAVPGVPVHVVPHFAPLPGPGPDELQAWREAAVDTTRARYLSGIALTGAPFIAVALGFPSAEKQLAGVIGAIARLPPTLRAQTVLLVAGEIRPGDPDLAALATASGCADRVRLLGWVSEAEAAALLLLADIVLGLHVPTRGESSGAVARGLGLGCAVVVSDHGSYAELPDQAVIKLPPLADPSEALLRLFTEIIPDRSRIIPVRRAAYTYAHAHCDPIDMAARYARIVAAHA